MLTPVAPSSLVIAAGLVIMKLFMLFFVMMLVTCYGGGCCFDSNRFWLFLADAEGTGSPISSTTTSPSSADVMSSIFCGWKDLRYGFVID